jgi:hypothetical protein
VMLHYTILAGASEQYTSTRVLQLVASVESPHIYTINGYVQQLEFIAHLQARPIKHRPASETNGQ